MNNKMRHISNCSSSPASSWAAPLPPSPASIALMAAILGNISSPLCYLPSPDCLLTSLAIPGKCKCHGAAGPWTECLLLHTTDYILIFLSLLLVSQLSTHNTAHIGVFIVSFDGG